MVTHDFMRHVGKTYVEYLGQDWDIDIKIWGNILGHWYQKFDGVPIKTYWVYLAVTTLDTLWYIGERSLKHPYRGIDSAATNTWPDLTIQP